MRPIELRDPRIGPARPAASRRRYAAIGVAVAIVLAAGGIAFRAWTPGLDVTDGRHDRGRNAVWLQHGWLGSDDWFRRERKLDRRAEFRDPARLRHLADLLRARHVTDVFPHLSPADRGGVLPSTDDAQVERFLDAFTGFRVLPWTGGVTTKTCRLGDSGWRRAFVQSVIGLLVRHPRFAGVHLNFEPCVSGSREFLTLLDGLRQALPAPFLLSVAAYPPPLLWQPFPEVHWDADYMREVARRVDQAAVMMYDTALPWPRVYQQVMRRWTRELLADPQGAAILLGVPAYDDAGRGYHDPRVENLANALLGIHSGLAGLAGPAGLGTLPERYQGVAIYAEWEMDDAEWNYWQHHFAKPEPPR